MHVTFTGLAGCRQWLTVGGALASWPKAGPLNIFRQKCLLGGRQSAAAQTPQSCAVYPRVGQGRKRRAPGASGRIPCKR